MEDLRQRSAALFTEIQRQICDALEQLDGAASFLSDTWERPDREGGYGGGGDTRVLRRGRVFEQAGVNFSEVHGSLPLEMSEKLVGRSEVAPFFATGVSLVIHPFSPKVPTTHANFRYLEVAELSWFGGGMDLTPYYLYEEDAAHFHQTIKTVCDGHSPEYYPSFKKQCDEYFFLPHRGEGRGVGGIFYDYLGKGQPETMESNFAFSGDIGRAFMECYLPIVERRKDESWGEREKEFQLVRRGRYVEFNLLYDRGTQFGLKTGGRTESILMSLPPQVRWEYDFQIDDASEESKILAVVKKPREWV